MYLVYSRLTIDLSYFQPMKRITVFLPFKGVESLIRRRNEPARSVLKLKKSMVLMEVTLKGFLQDAFSVRVIH